MHIVACGEQRSSIGEEGERPHWFKVPFTASKVSTSSCIKDPHCPIHAATGDPLAIRAVCHTEDKPLPLQLDLLLRHWRQHHLAVEGRCCLRVWRSVDMPQDDGPPRASSYCEEMSTPGRLGGGEGHGPRFGRAGSDQCNCFVCGLQGKGISS